MGTLDEYQENYLNCNQFRADFPKKRLGTADRFNDSVDDYKLLTEELKADIRDMEGCAVVQAAYCAQLPVFMMKAISDVAGSGNTAEQYFANKTKALENLSAALPTFFEEL
jgi:nucleoside phosphorylase